MQTERWSESLGTTITKRDAKMTAFFMDSKLTFSSTEAAMGWIITQAARFGMTGPEAEAKGYAQIFNT